MSIGIPRWETPETQRWRSMVPSLHQGWCILFELGKHGWMTYTWMAVDVWLRCSEEGFVPKLMLRGRGSSFSYTKSCFSLELGETWSNNYLHRGLGWFPSKRRMKSPWFATSFTKWEPTNIHKLLLLKLCQDVSISSASYIPAICNNLPFVPTGSTLQ